MASRTLPVLKKYGSQSMTKRMNAVCARAWASLRLATKRRDHKWSLCDLTNTFAEWMAQEQYRESFFESPEDVEITLGEFHNKVTQKLRVVLEDSSG